jgi:gliding motility-associated-like protein
VIYTWRVDGELQSDQDFELQMVWSDSTMDHSITVYGTDSVGCVGEKSYLTVHTDACLRLYIPISFTPNGDGFNDAFKIVGESIYNPRLKIFSRDGQVIHETNRIDQAWNGNDGNGYYCPNGVYNWILNYQDDRGFGHQEAGHVVLIR